MLPKYRPQARDVWTPSQAQTALDQCTDPVLRMAILLALGCSMRIGEVLGLTWDCVEFSDESIAAGTANVYVNKELKRCQKDSLEALDRRGRSKVVHFPGAKTDCLHYVACPESPEDGEQRPHRVPAQDRGAERRAVKKSQDALKMLLGADYADFGLVIAHEDRRPYEERQIAHLLNQLIQDTGLPKVVFHSLCHCSTSVKLQISGGNIKAVQGDTGHAQARMVTDLYAHTCNDDRRRLAQKMEESFFQKPQAFEKKRPRATWTLPLSCSKIIRQSQNF